MPEAGPGARVFHPMDSAVDNSAGDAVDGSADARG